jgi:hypothetical protein
MAAAPSCKIMTTKTVFASFGFRLTCINKNNSTRNILGRRSFHNVATTTSQYSVHGDKRCNHSSVVSQKTHHHHHQQQQQHHYHHHHHVLLSTQRRTLMTKIVEPPSDSTIPELPLTLILSEDNGFYETSWHQDFQSALPSQYGMSYGQFSMSPKTTTTTTTTTTSLDQAMQELKSDLIMFSSPSNVVLVTRGPWMSWMAQFYLEDLPLAALVMVDPMQLDDQNGLNQFQLQYNKLGLESSLQYKLFQEYAEHYSHWTLQLEPGVVPMMILYTNPRPGFKRCAENAALRHSSSKGGLFGPVPVVKMPFTSKTHAQDSRQAIMKWVTDNVL